MLNKQIFEVETDKLLVKNPSEKWVGVSLLLLLCFVFCFAFVFLLAFVFVVAVVVCLFFLVDFYF